ncbi:hypothetical protein F5141DRAFT_1065530 [Pisolithus sp. B1]|nr:hypothetical protein F5141DRAFT_1065530 [Pisolithus sp. B1]
MFIRKEIIHECPSTRITPGCAWEIFDLPHRGCTGTTGTVGQGMSLRSMLQAEEGWFMCWRTQVSFRNLFPHQGQKEVFQDQRSRRLPVVLTPHYIQDVMSFTANMHPLSLQAGQLGDIPPKQEPDFPNMDGIILRMEETGKWVQCVEQHLLEVEGHVGQVQLVIEQSGYAPGLGGELSSESEHNGHVWVLELMNAQGTQITSE